MRGRTLFIGLGVLLAVFAGALWYTQLYAFYRELPKRPLVVQGTEYPVETFSGIEGTSSPLKLRICARVAPETAATIRAAHPAQDPGEPLVAPPWFDCFDARRIARDLKAGRATFHPLGPTPFEGVSKAMALYADGRVFVWPELDARFGE